MNPGWRAMKRARSVINDNASACLPGFGFDDRDLSYGLIVGLDMRHR
jgi:hypothetical protein